MVGKAGRVMVAERIADRRSAVELRVIEGSAKRAEARAAWGRVRVLSNRVHLAVVAERPDIALAASGEITHIASRSLRRLGGFDDAA